jgi:hypothetical protein
LFQFLRLLLFAALAVVPPVDASEVFSDPEKVEDTAENIINDEQTQWFTAYSNRENANVLETLSVPGAAYDFSSWAYDQKFAENVGLPLDLIQLIDPPQEHVRAIQLMVKTEGFATICKFGVLLDREIELQVPEQSWTRPFPLLQKLLLIDRGLVSRSVVGADTQPDSEITLLPDHSFNGHSVRGNFGEIVDEEGLPDFATGLTLYLVNYDLAPTLQYLELKTSCESVARASTFLAQNDGGLFLSLRRRAPITPNEPKVVRTISDANYYFVVDFPTALMERSVSIYSQVLIDQLPMRKFGFSGGKLLSSDYLQ